MVDNLDSPVLGHYVVYLIFAAPPALQIESFYDVYLSCCGDTCLVNVRSALPQDVHCFRLQGPLKME